MDERVFSYVKMFFFFNKVKMGERFLVKLEWMNDFFIQVDMGERFLN